LDKFLGGQTARVLERAMDGAALRHKVIANNIANVNTPNFKRSDVQFETLLARSLQDGMPLTTTHPKHLALTSGDPAAVQPRIVTDRSISMRNDGNNVDIDVENARMLENNVYFEAVARQATAIFERLRTAIKGGGS